MTPYSAAADGSFSSLPSSRSAALRTPSGSSSSSRRERSSVISAWSASPSPELLLDRLELLAQEELALSLLHLLLHLRLDLRAELEDLELAVQDRRDRP
jgi:hypothetical protein